MQTHTPMSLWRLVSVLEAEHARSWRREFYPGLDLELAMQEHVISVEVTVKRLRGRNVSVTLVILARKESDSLTSYTTLENALGGTFTVRQSTLSKE